jgi:WD40 repeat protein
MIVGGGEDPRTYVWNTSLGVRGVLQASDDLYDPITGVAWGPKDRIATVDDSGMHVHVWHKPKAGLVLHLRGSLAATGGAIVADFSDKGLEVHDLAKDKRVRTIADAKPAVDKFTYREFDQPHLRVSRDGTRALAWASQGAVVYDLAAGVELRRLAAIDPDANGAVTTWQMSSDGKRAVELADKRARVFDLDTGAVILDRTDDVVGPQGGLSPAGDRLVFASAPMVVWRVPSGESIPQPDLDVEMKVIRHSGGQVVYLTSGPNRPVFDPTGARILVISIETPLVVDVATGKTLARLHMPVDVSAGVLDDGGHHAATQAQDATTLWDADTGTLLFTVPGTAKDALALTHDGTRLATGHPDGTVRIWDQQGRLLEVIHDHRRAITSLAFTDDGRRLVANGADGWMSVVDVHLETRTPAQISAIAESASSWQVVGGGLLPRKSK